jgi:hypothetical protein
MSSTQSVWAQDEGYRVHVRKDFGYSWASDIQGRFTIQLQGDETQVDKVAFLIDENVLGTVNSSPFKISFDTGDFPEGVHQISAEVHLRNGSLQKTPSVTYSFLAAAETNQQVKNLLIGIGVAIVGIFAIVALVQSLFFKKNKTSPHQPGEPRNYGMLGGTICSKCGRPFPRHIFGINLVVGRLDRCENCGKWVMTTRATPAALRTAEMTELDALKADQGIVPSKDTLKKNLDDSRFYDDL